MTINEMLEQAHSNSRAKGWWEEQMGAEELRADRVIATIPEKLALIHSEVSEALEAYRGGFLGCIVDADSLKPEGFASELADVLIRCGDLAGALGIDLEAAVKQKMAYNATRPHRHGGKRC